MVQFIFTPWRNRAELLRVRSQFYPSSDLSTTTTAAATTGVPKDGRLPWSAPEELDAINKAIARVFMWVHRGHCPHVVESTALLMSAIVFDETRGPHDAVSGAAVRAGYLVGFTRFVTGLLDSHQDKARKLSMYGVAKTIGLPASFVELRHQGTHEPMPSLTQLRPAARRALDWIWEYYWKNLAPAENENGQREGTMVVAATGGLLDIAMRDAVDGDGADATKTAAAAAKEGKQKATTTTTRNTTAPSRTSGLQERMCRTALMSYLQRQEGDVGGNAAKEGLMRQLQQWDAALVVKVLAEVGGSARDKGLLFRSVKLSRAILGRNPDEVPEAPAGGEEEWRAELSRAREEVEDGAGRTIAVGSLLGKRKKGEGQPEEEEGDTCRGRSGWFEWKGPWTPRPIGCL